MSTKKVAKKGREAADDWAQAEEKRISEVIQELSKQAPVQVAPHVKKAAPYLAKAAVYAMIAMPYILDACSRIQAFVASLPEKIVYAGLGFAVCFFGGIFPATIAAIEAWRLCGGDEATACCKALYNEWQKVQQKNKEDDQKDEDKDGKADTKQLSPQQLIVRKTQVVLAAVDPETVSHGVVGLYTGWIGVLAILQHKFARTVTLGERIGEQIYRLASRFEPALAELVPDEYRKWVPVGLRWACKMAAMSVAWWTQRVLSAFHSAIRGGLLFGKYLVEFLHEKNVLKADASKTYIDEAIGWGVAVVGLLFQVSLGFHVPFPLSLVTWPLQLMEAIIVWSVGSV
jgi:hypothetical protein